MDHSNRSNYVKDPRLRELEARVMALETITQVIRMDVKELTRTVDRLVLRSNRMTTKKFRTELKDGSVLIVTTKLEAIGNHELYFSITGEMYETYMQKDQPTTTNSKGKELWLGGYGEIHREIATYMPELKPYIKWHFVSESGPIKYISNALYWSGGYPQYASGGDTGIPNVKNLEATIVYGALDSDKDVKLTDMLGTENSTRLQEWLYSRHPALRAQFVKDMETLFSD